MAKFRYVNTRFWDDTYIASLDPNQKLLFLYLLTNSLTTIAGVYEINQRRIVFDTGLAKTVVEGGLKKFQDDAKIVFQSQWLGIVNFVKHQSLNPKVLRGISLALVDVPSEIVDQLNLPPRVRIGMRKEVPSPRRAGLKHISDLISP